MGHFGEAGPLDDALQNGGCRRRLPWVPSEEQVRALYAAVWRTRRKGDLVLIETLLYTGVRVSELVKITLADVGLDACQIRINVGKGKKDRVVPFARRSRRRWPCT